MELIVQGLGWYIFGPIFSRIHLLASNLLYLGIERYG